MLAKGKRTYSVGIIFLNQFTELPEMFPNFSHSDEALKEGKEPRQRALIRVRIN